jgi:hypothetical protein
MYCEVKDVQFFFLFWKQNESLLSSAQIGGQDAH